jgi:hypothetical protein
MPVTEFLDDDDGYTSWLAAHRNGFVVNTSRSPTASYLKLHRTTCHTITGVPTAGSRWTVQYIKVCGDRRAELEAWCQRTVGVEPERCPHCHP